MFQCYEWEKYKPNFEFFSNIPYLASGDFQDTITYFNPKEICSRRELQKNNNCLSKTEKAKHVYSSFRHWSVIVMKYVHEESSSERKEKQRIQNLTWK